MDLSYYTFCLWHKFSLSGQVVEVRIICLLKLVFSFSSSFTCGLAGALASNPVDVVRTRMMNQRAIVGHVDLYKGTLDGILKVCVLWIWVTLSVFLWCLRHFSVFILLATYSEHQTTIMCIFSSF